MKTHPPADALRPEIIAIFGEARLVKDLDGKCTLLGGSNEDRAAAHEWIDMFLGRAVVE